MTTRMWEVRAAEGKVEGLIAWAHRHLPQGAQLYRSADDRIVVIDPTGRGMPAPPAGLVGRPPHSWDFEPVPPRG